VNNPRRSISTFYGEVRRILRVYRKPDGSGSPAPHEVGLTPEVIKARYEAGADPVDTAHTYAERMGLEQRSAQGYYNNPVTSPGQFPYISQYVYNPRRNRALTLTDFADVMEAVVGLTPKERRLLLMDSGGRMTRLLPKAEAKLRAKGFWPPKGETEAEAAPPVVVSEVGGKVMIRDLLGGLDEALTAGGDEGMIAEFRRQLQSPAAREAYLSVLDL
jgi:hypothetical protein